jgi:transcriptional regulator with XRE-family HTH domain
MKKEPLRAIRERKRLTQRQLAAKTKPPTTFSTVSRIECGRQKPSLQMAEKLAEALGVRVEQIAF